MITEKVVFGGPNPELCADRAVGLVLALGTGIRFDMAHGRLFESELARRILHHVIEAYPLDESHPGVGKARTDITGGAHPHLSFIRTVPHRTDNIHVLVSGIPAEHELATTGATAVTSTYQQPAIHVIPDVRNLPTRTPLGYECS